MNNLPTEKLWQEQVVSELTALQTILTRAGYTLDAEQPHTLGERFLMQNITTQSGKKLILLGSDMNKNRVIIKATKDEAGKQELAHERACRQQLHTINFAYETFHAPEEIAYWDDGEYLLSVQAFIEQTSSFIERPLEEQFRFALHAFKTQESARATTGSHYRTITKVFGIRTSADYIKLATKFCNDLNTLNVSSQVQETCAKTLEHLQSKRERIEQYCGFLTHTDFVPHNFRIKDDTIYLLDTASLEFGNKHEGWARFLNFMTLYNYKLENALVEYVEKNRASEERESLQLMRQYRLVEIITYYATTLEKSNDDLRTLNQARIDFWHEVLLAELENKRVRRDIVEAYRIKRDRLRTRDEKKRQENLH